MTEFEFWEFIASTKRSDPDEHVERLVEMLAKLPATEILAFGHHWYRLHGSAYIWRLWGAAYLMNGGCSDDGFHYFRSWLLLQGEDIFTRALVEPDTLAKVRVEPDESECECYPACRAYEMAMKTGSPSDFYDALAAAHGPNTQPSEPIGESWDFDDSDEMAKRLPKLFKKFGDA